MATVTLTRPLRMLFFELIVLATCLYLSLIYGIFYMYFEAYKKSVIKIHVEDSEDSILGRHETSRHKGCAVVAS
jgi:hypothetical protein